MSSGSLPSVEMGCGSRWRLWVPGCAVRGVCGWWGGREAPPNCQLFGVTPQHLIPSRLLFPGGVTPVMAVCWWGGSACPLRRMPWVLGGPCTGPVLSAFGGAVLGELICQSWQQHRALAFIIILHHSRVFWQEEKLWISPE